MRTNDIRQLIEPTIRAMGLELWGCHLSQQGHRAVLRIFIDGGAEKSVTLDDCVSVSREVGALLDVENSIQSRYQLEVSSPGVERPLLTLSHFARYVGSHVKVKMREAHDGRRQFVGRIEKVVGDSIFFTVDHEVIQTSMSDIQKATLEA